MTDEQKKMIDKLNEDNRKLNNVNKVNITDGQVHPIR